MIARRHPARRRLSQRQSLAALLATLAALFLLRFSTPAPPPDSTPPQLKQSVRQVQRVIDGDTLLLDNKQRLRLIGVDTPETVKRDHPQEPWGREATQFTRDFIGPGEVRLQFDQQRTDQYGRLLAYVWVGDRMLNEELLLAGLARVETQYRYNPTFKDRFLQAEADARAARRGIWSHR